MKKVEWLEVDDNAQDPRELVSRVNEVGELAQEPAETIQPDSPARQAGRGLSNIEYFSLLKTGLFYSKSRRQPVLKSWVREK